MSAPLLSMTSKTSSLKALLLRAWRERWSDLQWGIHIKTILPRGVSGDVYNLADCILQQALVGPGPNQLVVSYLKHSLSSQLVSYAAVLQRISKYDGFHKPHCIISLLEFLETIQGGITCRGKPEEGLLAAAVLSIVQWLLTCMQHALKNLPELRTGNADHTAMMDKPGAILDAMMKCDFMVAMLYLAKHECRDVYHEVVKKCQDLESLLNQSLPYQPSIPVTDILRKLSHLEIDGDSPDKTNDNSEPVTYCLQALLAIEVLLNPSSDTQVFVNELLMVQRLKGYNMARLYCEVMRACFISLNDVFSTSKESQWIAFTFLKLPHILRQLHITVRGESPDSQEKGDFSQDVVDSFDLLLQYTPLLDNMDAKCSCNCLECLLKELLKIGLVTEAHVKHYSSKRENTISALQRLEVNPSPSLPVPKVVVRAEPTLASVLKTLDADYTEEKLLGMLCQVLTGKSFELIIAVAAVDGKLRTFFNKLIKVNQSSRQIKDKEDKATLARAILFDVTFLMLCYIVHTYGSEAVLSEEEGSSFFEQWVRECMVERGRPKSPDQMLQHCDQSRVDALLTQFNSPDGEVTTSQVKWHEMCFHVPAAIKEVLLAWEHGSVSANDVKRNLDAMRSRMCCLPVCAAAWLCSYMQILHQDALLKPMNMVQQFLTQPSSEEISQQDNFKERFGLMCQIIRKMQYDVHPPTQSKVKVKTLSHSIISRQPISEQLEAVWVGIQGRGWVNIEATHSLESLLNTGGSHWFVTNLVKEVLKFRYQEDLDRAVDLAFAVFHLDIEHCTLALLLHVLPQYLHNRLLSEELVEPQASALAKLCAYCVFAALEFQNNSSSGQISSRKRSRRDMEGEDLDGFCPSTKLLRLTSSVSESPDASSLFGTATPTNQNTSSSRSYGNQPVTVREPLQSALNDLFNTFTTISGRDGEVSQQTHFVCRFLQFVVQCGRDRTRLVLQGMPNTLVPCLLRSLPDLFTTELLLKLYDIQTVAGRKVTARDLCMLRNMSLKLAVKDIT